MYINFWYPLAVAEDLSDEPRKLTVLGQELALFRGTGNEIRCISNTCVHRGASLADGRIADGCLECPYHGWRFDGDGNCVRIPSLGKDGAIPARAKIDAYPVLEKYGVIFAFLGDLTESNRPPLMEIENHGDDDWRLTVQVWDVPVNYERVIENGIDLSHNEFTHTTHIETQAGVDHFVINDVELGETEWTTELTLMMPGPGPTQKDIKKASGNTGQGDVPITTGHHGPNCLYTFIRPTAEMRMRQYFYLAPIDAFNTRIFLLTNRNFIVGEEFDDKLKERNLFVAGQDREVLQGVLPSVTPASNTEEVLVPADKPMARYRQLLKSWEAKGWRIDAKQQAELRAEKAMAIPGPRRREKKGWPIGAVPLHQADTL